MSSPHFLELLDGIEEGENILLIGPGGCGKSVCVNVIKEFMRKEHQKNVAMTATTGISALNIKGSTLHRWAGIGTGDIPIERLVIKVANDPKIVEKIQACDILVIDEISMLGYELFGKIDWIFKVIRDCEEKPFGGIQVIFTGDFLQLPPVKDHWPFLHQKWKELELKPFILETPRRYTNLNFFHMLLRVREGKQTKQDIKALRTRFEAYKKMMAEVHKEEKRDVERNDMCVICSEEFKKGEKPRKTACNHFFHQPCLDTWMAENKKVSCPTCRGELEIRPTILYSRKKDVTKYNLGELEKCPGPTIIFHAKDSIHHLNPEKADSRNIRSIYKTVLEEYIPSIITLRVGAQVMLKANISVEEGLVNGSRGVVTELVKNSEEQYAMVKFMDGKERKIVPWSWDYGKEDDIYASREQLPLILAYAITIHKSQACTIDSIICDLGPSVFSAGQAYVALSRVRCLEGLYLSNFVASSIKVDKVALKFHKQCVERQKSRDPIEYECTDEKGEFLDSDQILTNYIKLYKIDLS